MRVRGCGVGVGAGARGETLTWVCGAPVRGAKRWRKIRAGATGRGGAEASQDPGRKFFAKWAEKDDPP